MRLEFNELVSEYFAAIRSNYTTLSYDNIRDIVIAPWCYLKSSMESGNLDRIRLKYFGIFYVPPGRAKRLLAEAKYRFDKKYITPKQYFKIKESIEAYLEKLEAEGNSEKEKDNEEDEI